MFLPPSESGASIVAVVDETHIVKAPLRTSLANEVKAQKAAKKAGAAAVVVNKAVADFAFVQEFQQGAPKKQWDDDDVAAVGRALAKLHALDGDGLVPLGGGATPQASINEARTALAVLVKCGAVSAADAKVVGAVVDDHGDAVAAVCEFGVDVDRVFVHGDVRADNVFFDGKGVARFIDFGLAGRGDPAVEVARVVGYQRLSDHQAFVLVDAWADAGDRDGDVDRAVVLGRAMPLLLALNAARYVVNVARGAIVVVDKDAVVGRLPAIAERLSLAVGATIRLQVKK